MAIKPMSTLSFNGGGAFEIIDQEARNNIAELKELHPATGKVGQILEVETVDENSKPLTYRAVDNNPNIEVDETLTQEGMAADAKATGEALKNISVDETLTLAEYQALSEEEKDSNKTFYIDDEDIINIDDLVKINASHIAFDNTGTTLTSKEVQGALVEVDNKIENFHDAIDGLSEQIDEIEREFISDIYDETKTYTVDSYCINDNKLYKCTTETTGSFDGSCWKETSMTDELVTQSIAISEQNKKKESYIQFLDSIAEYYNMNKLSKKNGVVYGIFSFKAKTTVSSGTHLAEIPSEYKLMDGSGFYAPLYDTNGNSKGVLWISTSGDISYYGSSSLAANTPYYCNFTYVQ